MYHRRLFIPYATVGAAWFSAFAVYSWYHFSQVLPNYYFVYQHFGSTPLWLALLGNLISPSRGLLVFVPVLFFVSYLLLRYRAALLPGCGIPGLSMSIRSQTGYGTGSTRSFLQLGITDLRSTTCSAFLESFAHEVKVLLGGLDLVGV
ncbi:MAG: hypothetical protein ABR568_22760, partial [Pyrinomonadaceae bacterium]